ncbi:hypothetical protein DM02DRAFT_643881 [Periconia macrospinosa]|uniref:Zn(2)-C6 fungal-type domain-containing protein n=1 Tax=Periconia macrospinosa TaxID=97972 RepID=A0A2V1DJV6_9PLEO|nr:hypothetical protein DM02DRAFT_643881 [Periconia macrospinosa]
MDQIDAVQEPELLHRKRIRRVALACIPCRSRKVKCDATQPACHRCRSDEKICEYQKSRRGGRPRKQKLISSNLITGQHPRLEDSPQWIGTTINSRNGSVTHSPDGTTDSQDLTSQSEQLGSQLTKSQTDHLLTQYYTYFHNAHSCVLPRWSLEAHTSIEPAVSEYLIPVLLYIGSIFVHCVDSKPLAEAAARAIEAGRGHQGLPSPYFAQALMLYSIPVYWSNETLKGRKLLDEAIHTAFALGMHRKGFAAQYGLGDPVLEESWRRTWWQMHITDVHVSGSMHTFEGLSSKYPITTELPCEESQYESGDIPTPNSLQQYENREFSDLEFSSFAQLIGFTQGITRVLLNASLDDIGGAQTLCANADTMMTAWCSLLPPSKKSLLGENGSVDEVLFKAMIVMQTCVVELHRRLSSLLYSPIESASSCAPPPPPSANDTIKEEAHIHTAKILCATEKLNTLLTLPTRFATHTPFNICMIANMTIAQLSACRYIFQEPRLSAEREKIRLNMGVLKMLGEFWPAGKREYKAVGIIARTILGLREEEVRVPPDVEEAVMIKQHPLKTTHTPLISPPQPILH